MKKLRVLTDFSGIEQQALLAMCQEDYRLPDDQIRYLVIAEANKRGLLSLQTNSDASGLVLAGGPTGINR